MVWLGGLAEFATSLFTILSFNQAVKSNVNAGLAGVLFPLSSPFVATFTYWMYGEWLSLIQGIGIITVLAGATLIAAFPAEAVNHESATPT